ncbi:hypothetical protein ONZ45_g9847 [Pleurotus djamor]|nr:hypothetical protein ONZ45_g9847 [Pleurotus djamor]
MGLPSFTLALSILNFVGSVCSSAGSGFIILCYLILPRRRHFRHVLILNLAIADFLNATNNAASGSLILIRQRPITASPACVFNGFMSQITITLVTVYTITRTSHSRTIQAEWSNLAVLITCCAIWLLPCLTSFIALGNGWYGPVSGNWCWLVDKPVHLRYVLTHGWRFLFIFTEIALSIYLHIYLRRHFRTLRVPIVSSAPSRARTSLPPMQFRDPSLGEEPKQEIVIHITHDTHRDSVALHPSMINAPSMKDIPTNSNFDLESAPSTQSTKPTNMPTTDTSTLQLSLKEHPRYKAIKRILLLNAYPLFYILLWIPGLANRMVEASGNKSKVTQIMQASTQFVGLANALTYGWNERIARELKLKFSRRRAW